MIHDALLAAAAFLLGWNAQRWMARVPVMRAQLEDDDDPVELLSDTYVHQAAPNAAPESGYVLLNALRRERLDD